MKFSIVIPCYKVEKYLSECVDSILNQTFTDFELILVDNGSPDRVPEMCDKYAAKDARVKVVHYQENIGVACARNAGVAEATGEYLIGIDSDDYIVKNDVFERIAAKTESGVDVVLYGYQKLFESNNAFGERNFPVLNGVCSTGEMLKIVLKDDTYCGTVWTKAVRLNVLQEHKIEFRPGIRSEDIEWNLHLMCYAKTFDSINDIAIIYRQRSDSTTRSHIINSLTDNLWILENWPERIKSIVKDQTTADALMSVMAYYFANVMILYSGYSRSQSAPYRKRLKDQSYLLDYAVTSRAQTVRKFYKVLGFDITAFLLKIMSKLKTRY